MRGARQLWTTTCPAHAATARARRPPSTPPQRHRGAPSHVATPPLALFAAAQAPDWRRHGTSELPQPCIHSPCKSSASIGVRIAETHGLLLGRHSTRPARVAVDRCSRERRICTLHCCVERAQQRQGEGSMAALGLQCGGRLRHRAGLPGSRLLATPHVGVGCIGSGRVRTTAAATCGRCVGQRAHARGLRSCMGA